MPIKEANITYPEFETVDSATYPAVLEDVEESMKPAYKEGDPDVPAFKFRYRISENVLLTKEPTQTVGAKSHLPKDLRALGGVAADEALRTKDMKVIAEFINSLIGAECLVSVEKRTSAAGNDYNNIVSVIAKPIENETIEKVKEEAKEKSVSFDDDDIPF